MPTPAQPCCAFDTTPTPLEPVTINSLNTTATGTSAFDWTADWQAVDGATSYLVEHLSADGTTTVTTTVTATMLTGNVANVAAMRGTMSVTVTALDDNDEPLSQPTTSDDAFTPMPGLVDLTNSDITATTATITADDSNNTEWSRTLAIVMTPDQGGLTDQTVAAGDSPQPWSATGLTADASYTATVTVTDDVYPDSVESTTTFTTTTAA